MVLYYLYAVMLLISPLKYFLPSSIASMSAILREMILLSIIFISLLKYLSKFYYKKIYLYELATLFFFVVVIFYSSISKYNYELFQNIVLYSSGPLLLIFTPCFITNSEKAKLFVRNLSIVLLVYLIINIIIFPFQYYLLLLSTVPQDQYMYLYRYTYNKRAILRFFGLTFMPTSLGWMCIMILLSPFNKIIGKCVSFVSLYLTRVRLFYPGVICSYFVSAKNRQKIYLFFIMIPLVFILFIYYSSRIDSSLDRHLEDILWRGPDLIVQNFMGIGFNENIKVESDIYMFFIRFGILGGLLYISIFMLLYSFLKNNVIKNDEVIIYGKRLTIVYIIGSFILPLTTQRLIGNMYWVVIAVICTYGQLAAKSYKILKITDASGNILNVS